MAPKSLIKCASCGISATTKCSGCIGAPEYELGDCRSVVYCGRDCQRAHWPSHKAECKAMQQRKKILRSAILLKVALLAYREAVYDIDLKKIDYRDGTLYIHQNQRSPRSRAKRGPFPNHLTTNIEHKEAALTVNQCTLAMALLGPLTRKLLREATSSIEIVDLQIGRPRVPTKLMPGPNSDGCPHTVLKLRRAGSNETWALDTTGCQYGFREVLVPFEKYLMNNDGSISSPPNTYDARETKDLDYFDTLPFMNMFKAQQQDRRLERQARLHFATFVDTRVGGDLLIGSEASFKGKVDKFADELKGHMIKLTE